MGWTGSASTGSGTHESALKRIGALRFVKLRTSPGKTYCDVENVRTKDNALLTVKLMIFFRYVNVEAMLDNTNDPFGDIINAVTADVIEWCAPKRFDDFLAATDALNTLDLYAQLRSSVAKIGMEIQKVVFRGYEAPSSLQRLHDGAIEKRTSLALAKESEEEEQRLADFKLKRETERAQSRAKLEMSRCDHDLAKKTRSFEAEQKIQRQNNEIELGRLRAIKALDENADIGQYLIASECALPPVIQCGTLMSGRSGSAGDDASSHDKRAAKQAINWLGSY